MGDSGQWEDDGQYCGENSSGPAWVATANALLNQGALCQGVTVQREAVFSQPPSMHSHQKCKNNSNQQDAGDALEGLSVSKSFLQSAIGDRGKRYDNESLKRFANLTEKKKITAGSFMGRQLAAQRKWQPSTGAKIPMGLEGVKKVCFLGEFTEKLPPSAIGDG